MLADLVTLLETDATLQTLLGGGNGNTRVFDGRRDGGELTPCIIYNIQNDSGEENIDHLTVNLNTVVEASKAADGRAIVARLVALLDLQDALEIPSTTHNIWYGKKVGGADAYISESDHIEMPRLFLFKYKMK